MSSEQCCRPPHPQRRFHYLLVKYKLCLNRDNELVIPYAMSDINSGIATVGVNNLLGCMRAVAD
jgi:hypothetical protein